MSDLAVGLKRDTRAGGRDVDLLEPSCVRGLNRCYELILRGTRLKRPTNIVGLSSFLGHSGSNADRGRLDRVRTNDAPQHLLGIIAALVLDPVPPG